MMRRSDPKRTFHELENGLRVVVIELPHRYKTTISCYIRAGSRFESTQENGLSHFLEHMLFRGTKTYPNAYLFNRAIEVLGGTLHAETRRDLCLYQVELPMESLNSGLRCFSEIFVEPTLSDIETERNVILEEAREDFDERGNDTQLSDLIYQKIFRKDPLAQKIIGPLSNIQTFQPKDLLRHFQKHYGAKNMVLCLAGPISFETVLPILLATMAQIPTGTEHPWSTPVPYKNGPSHVHRRGDGGIQSVIHLSFRTQGELSDEFPAMLLLNRILDDGLSTRLYQKIVNELGLAYYVTAGMDSFVDTGVFELEAVAIHKNIPTLFSELMQILMQIGEKGVSSDEIAHAQRRYRWDLLSALDDPYSLSEWWAATRLYYSPHELGMKLERFEKVSSAHVKEVARKVFSKENMVLGTLGTMQKSIKNDLLLRLQDG